MILQNKKKCSGCHETKSLADFPKNKSEKSGFNGHCKICHNKGNNKWRNTEGGFLRTKYLNLCSREVKKKRSPNIIKCYFTFDEFRAAWEKHKSVYGMKSAWGPGIDNLERHLPITMISEGNGQLGKPGNVKGSKRIGSNLSVDRLDPYRDYTIQNIIFIRSDENDRKKHTTYDDCSIQMRLHEERFIKMKSI